MPQPSKQVVSRSRQKVHLITFNDSIIEGFIFVTHGQRVSDLLNDDRGFIPVESQAGDVRVVSKRAIMEIEILDRDEPSAARDSAVVVLGGGNAYDLLGVEPGADDGVVRAVFLDRMHSIDLDRLRAISANADLIKAAQFIRDRYAAAYDSICHTRQIEAIAAAVRAAQPKRRRFGEE